MLLSMCFNCLIVHIYVTYYFLVHCMFTELCNVHISYFDYFVSLPLALDTMCLSVVFVAFLEIYFTIFGFFCCT